MKLGISVTAGSWHYPLHVLGVMETIVHLPLKQMYLKYSVNNGGKKKSLTSG